MLIGHGSNLGSVPSAVPPADPAHLCLHPHTHSAALFSASLFGLAEQIMVRIKAHNAGLFFLMSLRALLIVQGGRITENSCLNSRRFIIKSADS